MSGAAAAGRLNDSARDVGATRQPVRVAGVGEAEPVAADPRSIPEIVLEVVQAALADAGIGYSDVDAVVTASVDLYDGLTASNIAVTEVVGAVMKPETRVAGDGIAALAHAACLLWSGAYETVLVVAHGKASMAPQDAVSRWALDPALLQSLEFGFDAYVGLQAQALAAADPGAVQRWARVAAVARGCSAAEVLNSPMVADPLRALMRAPDADGACAVVLRARPAVSSTEGAGSDGGSRGAVECAPRRSAPSALLRDVLLTGIGFDLDQHLPGDRDLIAWTSLTRAFGRALANAGVRLEEIDLVRTSCRYPHEAELFAAATGLELSDWRPEPVVPVAAGLSRLIAATRTLRGVCGVSGAVPDVATDTAGRAEGDREAIAPGNRGPRTALAHGTWGPAGQAHAVAVLQATEAAAGAALTGVQP